MIQGVLILCPDRDYANRFRQKLIGSVLPQARIEIETDALRSLQPTGRQYDIIIMDPMVTNLDGLQLLVLLKQRIPNAEIVVLSQSELYQPEAERLGASLFLLKPSSKEEWNTAMEEFASKFLPESGVVQSTSGTQHLNRVDLIDILRLQCAEGKTSMIQFSNTITSGEIFIFEGDIFHAQVPGISGEDALHLITQGASESGNLKIYPLKSRPPRTIEKPWGELLGEVKSERIPVPDTQPLPMPLEKPRVEEEEPSLVSLQAVEEMKLEAPQIEEKPVQDSGTTKPAMPPASRWKIDVLGHIQEHTELPEPQIAANLTHYLVRKFNDVAVALQLDDVSRITLRSPALMQEIVCDPVFIHHALFEPGTTEEDREAFVQSCHAKLF